MLNKLIQFNYPQARYIILKEFDTLGKIAKLFAMPHEQLGEAILGLGEEIEQRNIALEEYHKTGVWGEVLTQPIPNNYLNIIVRISRDLPHHILCHSEYEWNEFISAWLTFCNEYARLVSDAIEILQEHHEFKGDPEHMGQQMSDLVKSIQSTINLAEIGIGYSQLIKSTEHLLEKMEQFEHDRPDIVRVSRAYLETLGYSEK